MNKIVLLVDDDPVNNSINQIILEKTHLVSSIFCVSNGSEAIAFLEDEVKANRSLPDLILLDINMLYMNGLEFMQEVKTHAAIDHKKLRIIILSSFISRHDQEIATTLGVTRFLEKPLTMLSALGILHV